MIAAKTGLRGAVDHDHVDVLRGTVSGSQPGGTVGGSGHGLSLMMALNIRSAWPGPTTPSTCRRVGERHGDKGDVRGSDIHHGFGDSPMELRSDRFWSVVNDFVPASSRLNNLIGLVSTPALVTLADHRRDEVLLALDALDVAAVAEGLLRARTNASASSPLMVCLPAAGPNARDSRDRFLQADLDAIDGIHHLLEAVEVDYDEMVDVDAGEFSTVFDRAARTTDVEGLVNRPV